MKAKCLIELKPLRFQQFFLILLIELRNISFFSDMIFFRIYIGVEHFVPIYLVLCIGELIMCNEMEKKLNEQCLLLHAMFELLSLLLHSTSEVGLKRFNQLIKY